MTKTQAPSFKLLMPPAEALQKINNLLTEWKELKDLRIDNENALERARKACLKWSDYHRLLMRRVFSNVDLADEYSGADIDIDISGATLYEEIDDLRSQIDKKIYCLESVYELLKSMPAEDLVTVDATASARIIGESGNPNPVVDSVTVAAAVPTRIKEERDDSKPADAPATVEAMAPARIKGKNGDSNPADDSVTVDAAAPARIKRKNGNPGIFISYGHDEVAGKKVAVFMQRLELTPIMLREWPDKDGAAEKTGENTDAGFGVVLLTPDDEGRKKGDSALRERAGQNVLLELGYLMGRLGRKHVCALYKGPVEIPMDSLGVLFVPFDDSDDYWQLKLAKELKMAGFPVDMNKAV